ncbi:MAG TPA: type IV pilin protein [Gallionella sp.]|nr:type IV pilin protein [Gallionella sp.]
MKMQAGKMQKGFTLPEVMIVVAIMAILAAIAYPSYVQYVTRSNRSAAESFIMTVSNKQEQYMLDARQYASDVAATSAVTVLNLPVPPEVSKNYNIIVGASAVPPSYTITAQPKGTQLAKDTKCVNVSINQLGAKGISGPGPLSSCW